MTTLQTILKNEKNPAAIFGHIHRRKKQLHFALKGYFKGCLMEADYSLATQSEILDVVTIREFENRLRYLYSVETDAEFAARVDALDEIKNALSALGLTEKDFSRAREFGDGLGRICIFGADWSGVEAYDDVKTSEGLHSEKVAA